MATPRTVVKVDRLHPVFAWTIGFSQAISGAMVRSGNWAVATAQSFANVMAVLMGPAVLSVYLFAVWSLTSEMGWTDSFPFASGPLSSWIVWTGLAAAMHLASVVLRKQKDRS